MTAPVRIGQFLGTPVHAHRLNGVAIAEQAYAKGLVVGDHVHDVPIVSLVLRGSATEEARGASRDLTPQSLLFTPAFATHGHRFCTAGRWLNIHFSPSWMERAGLASNELRRTPLLVRGGKAVTWATRVGAELRHPDAVSTLAIEGALLLLVTELSRHADSTERRPPRWLRTVEEAIAAGGPRPPSLTELATLAGVHPSHLLRTFRRHHGTTVANYARQRRIERARDEVARGTRSLAAIAVDAGFTDQSHFTRVFKRAFGETPGHYERTRRSQ